MSKQFRSVYTFGVEKQTLVQVPAEGVSADGTPMTGFRDEAQSVPYFFAIKKPSRLELEKADLFYSKNVGELMQAGLISSALLAKRLVNDGGIFTDKEKKELANKKEEIRQLSEKISKLQSIVEADRTDDQKKELEDLNAQNFKLGEDVREYIIAENNLFENTAESKARTKVINWFFVELLYKQDPNGNHVPVFESEEENATLRYADKLDKYDDLLNRIEDDVKEKAFWGEALSKASQIVTLAYYRGWHLKPEDFDALIKDINTER